jgi:hypothetical protein
MVSKLEGTENTVALASTTGLYRPKYVTAATENAVAQATTAPANKPTGHVSPATHTTVHAASPDPGQQSPCGIRLITPAPQLPLTGGPLASPNPPRAPVLSSPAERATYTDTWAVPRAPVHVPSLWPAPGDQAPRRHLPPPARSDQT